jgi:hypothetical protein
VALRAPELPSKDVLLILDSFHSLRSFSVSRGPSVPSTFGMPHSFYLAQGTLLVPRSLT